ncbi:ankyrin [Neoconidiobolus thromboides FSU 785]|nr:ankyrin [Neoconidiobolus thromboides FSU 785]
MLLKLINLDVSLENEDYFIIQYCCKKGYTTIITYLFYQNTTYPSLNINYKNSLFFKLAIENSQLALATLLIELNIIYLPYINTLFINASSKQLLLSMDYLLSLGADINHENSRALREASYFNNLPSLEYLLTKGINVHAFNESSLLSACHKGYYKVVKLLIQYGSDINFNYGSSLRFSASSGHFKIVELLIKNNINLNSQYCGIKALRDSAKNGHLNIVRLLLENKVPINGLKDAPLLCAIIAGHYDVTLTLLEHGANVNSINSNLLTATFRNQRKDIMGLLKRFGYQC